MVADSIKSNYSRVPRKKKIETKQNKKKQNKQVQKAGLLDVILEVTSSKFTSFEPNQMILAGKQRGPLHIYLENQDGVRQRQFASEICVIFHDRHRRWCLY